MGNEVVDLYIKHPKKSAILPSAEYLADSYRKTAGKNGMRKFSVACLRYILTFSTTQSESPRTIADLYKILKGDDDLAIDHLASVRTGGEVQDPRKLPPHTFHQYGESTPCYLVKDKETSQEARIHQLEHRGCHRKSGARQAMLCQYEFSTKPCNRAKVFP